MLGQVDVEVDGGVEDGEKVGYLAHLLDPGRPGHILLSKIWGKIAKKYLLTLYFSVCVNSHKLGIHRTAWHRINTKKFNR